MEPWVEDIPFERQGLARRLVKGILINPLANRLPAGWLTGLLRFGESEMAAANWEDPGGWRSMVISYEGRPRQIADRLLVGLGTMAQALRNRKRLAGRLIARLIDAIEDEPVHVLCLGAGPGHIITDALAMAQKEAVATLVDINSDAFEYGRKLAEQKGVAGRVRFIEGDARDVERMLAHRPDILKMIGLCEYLTDGQIVDIASAVGEVMPPGAPIVVNSLSKAHGTDRFFRRVFGLHMNHRSPQQVEGLMGRAGFGGFTSIGEPLGVYQVVVARRLGTARPERRMTHARAVSALGARGA